MTIVDDRLLARCAFEAVGWNIGAAPHAIADIAVGNAVTSLRVLGVVVGPEILRTIRCDVEAILADPAKMVRAKAMAASVERAARAQTSRTASSHPMKAAV